MTSVLINIIQRLYGAYLLLSFLFGLGFFGWEPPEVPAKAEPLRNALFESGYIIPVILIVYFIVGISYITNRFVAFTTIILFPITLNIFLFHLFLNPSTIPLASVMFIPNVLFLYVNCEAYYPMIRKKSNRR